MCSWCKVQSETAQHILFECQLAQEVWDSLGLFQWIKPSPGENIFEQFKRLFNNGSKEQCVFLALICWSMWNRRNKWVWNQVAVSVFGLTNVTISLLASWKVAQLERARSISKAAGTSMQKWQVPQKNWLKINIDAATFTDLMSIVIGAVIRDENGGFVRAMCKQVRGTWSLREAEGSSLKEALSWVKQHGFKCSVFETDSKLLAEACNGNPGRSYFHSIIVDCVELFKHFEKVLLCFVPRFANEVAYLLARVSRSMSDFQDWEGVAPSFLSNIFSYDLI
ncbi:uncharacterized protein LOC141700630 [Apium graveolens]|uniref:uncharacterized protein LOC141700630 n=1 Tax=Apium graveolens TaxID=4045 RepID=UPI003D796D2B